MSGGTPRLLHSHSTTVQKRDGGENCPIPQPSIWVQHPLGKFIPNIPPLKCRATGTPTGQAQQGFQPSRPGYPPCFAGNKSSR